MPVTYTINIAVDDHGNFTYSTATQHALRDDSIYWTCGNGPFAVHLGARTPFHEVVIHGTKAEGTPLAAGKIRSEAERGTYKYAVAVARVDDKGQVLGVHIDACPELIVETPRP